MPLSMLLNLQIAFVFILFDLFSAFTIVGKLLKLFYLSVTEHYPDYFSPLCLSTLSYGFASFAHCLNAIISQCMAHWATVLLGDVMFMGGSTCPKWGNNLSLQTTSSSCVTYHDDRSHQKPKPLNPPN